MASVVRSKGFFWMASRHNDIGIWHQAGRQCGLSWGEQWIAAVPAGTWGLSQVTSGLQRRQSVQTLGTWVAINSSISASCDALLHVLVGFSRSGPRTAQAG